MASADCEEVISSLLLSPSRHVVGEFERSKARILSALLLGRFFAIVTLLAFLSHQHSLTPFTERVIWLAIFNCVLSYGLSRWRYYNGACLLVAFESIVGITAACVQDPTLVTILGGTMWFGLTVLICGLVLSARFTLGVVLVTVAAFGFIRLHVTGAVDTGLIGNFIYFMTASALTLVGTILRDSAEQKLAQERARLAQASKLAALGEMANGMAHEVNNPLAILGALAGEIREIAQDDSPDRELLGKLAQTQAKTIDRIARIVQNLRQFARDPSSDPLERVSVKEAIEDARRLCAVGLEREGIDLRLEPFERDLFFAGRIVEISQVLVCLLDNARDAVASMKSKWIQVRVVERAKWFEILVIDSGNGLSPEIEEKLFQPFFTTKEVGRGMGLGLSVALGIVRAHNGELFLDRKNANTCFTVRLPKA